MIAIPTVDLRAGACVRPIGLSSDAGDFPLGEPVTVARRWAAAGFRFLQVIDVDASPVAGANTSFVEEIARDGAISIQVGGGVQSLDQVERILEAGASRVVVAPAALNEPDWLFELSELFPGVLVIPTAVRERRVVTRGWVRDLPLDIHDLVDDLRGAPLGGLLVASVRDDAQHAAADLAMLEELVEMSSFPIMSAGGAASMDALRALEHRGISAVVLGCALYSGALEPRAVAAEFGG